MAERAKQILLKDYPYTSYAEFVRNPKSNTFVKSSEDVENTYKQAYALYEAEKFAESKAILDQAIQQYPKDALVPKLYLLNAFNSGKANGKEVMILQLEQIALNYTKTPEGIKAKEMLNYLKSDVKFQPTDNKGNTVPQNKMNNNVAPQQPNNAPQQIGTLNESNSNKPPKKPNNNPPGMQVPNANPVPAKPQ